MKLQIFTANRDVPYQDFLDFQERLDESVIHNLIWGISQGKMHPSHINSLLIDEIYGILDDDCISAIFTYSPYVFTAINNMIAAHDVNADDLGIPLLNFDDVEAWELQANGSLKSLKNDENRLLTCGDIDSVSEETAILFDKILDRKFK